MNAEPPNARALAGQRIFVVGFILFFIASVIAVTLWGFQVTSSVRRQAQETDVAIRSLGWLILASTAEKGEFPIQAEALEGVASPEALPEVFAGTSIPATRQEAMAGEAPVPLQEAFEVLTVVWPPDGSLPPVIRTDGLPSGLGTLSTVNEWLLEAARRRSSGGLREGG